MSVRFEISGVRIAYGAREIVHDVSLSLREGELCALLGLNGSGKTTLLRGICGMIPMEGECRCGGEDMRAMNERMRAQHVSFIPQLSTDIHGKTVTEVVLMGANPHLKLLESPRAEHRLAAQRALEKLEIADFANRPFSELSQGQKQIVILARTLVQNAPVMLMDEPDSALDFLNRHMVLQKVREVIRTENKTGLVTLHDPNFAMAYCDRLFLLRKGSVAAELDMHTAGEAEVREKLALLYGNIELLPYPGGFLMGKTI